MNISIEISMYPLDKEYIAPIDKFLSKLHNIKGLKVHTNNMSTQVFGASDLVFPTLQKLIEDTYNTMDQCPFVIKVLKSDVSGNNIPTY